jgi:two-component system NtrC family response regulator
VRPLHLRLLAPDPTREDVRALIEAVRAAGHVVTTSASDPVPDTVPEIPDFVVSEGAAQPAPESLDAAEARHLAAVLHHTGGNRRQAAILLGIARSTLLAKIRRHGL